MHKEEGEMGKGGEEGLSWGHKLNIFNGFTDNYFIGHSISHSVGKKCYITVWFKFLNPTIIMFVIFSIYTERLFSLVYLWMNFIVGFIPSIKLSVKVTRLYTFVVFLLIIFSLSFSRYILMKCFHQCLPIDISMENSFCKIHHNLPTKKFCQCFHLYS